MGINLAQYGAGGGAPSWDTITSGLNNLTLNNGGFTTTFNQTSAVPWLWVNTTVASAITTNASPLLELAANYWTGAASAIDTWTLQSSLAAGTNGVSTLTFAHAGSTGINPSVKVPNLTVGKIFSAAGNLIGTMDGGGAGNFQFAGGWYVGMSHYMGYITGTLFFCSTDGELKMYKNDGTTAAAMLAFGADTGISRLGAASIALGNGTAADFTGTLKLNSVTEASANGATWTQGQASELLTLSTVGLTTDTTGLLLPAGAIIEAVVVRVTTAITVTTNWAVGDATISNRFAPALATLTLGTTVIGLTHVDLTGTSGPRQTAAAKVRITCTGSNPGAGAVRITVFYRQFVAPTS